jgi:hypothetical protein
MADVRLTITGEDKTAPARQGLIDTEKAIGMVKSAAAALGVTLGVMALVNYAKDATMLAARYNTMGASMTVVGNNAGYTRAQMDGFEQSLRKTGIAMIESRESLTRMASAHIDLSKSAELARVAQDAAVIGNINSSEAFERLVRGIQTAEVETLRNIGINVNFEDSYKKMGQQLGKNSAELSELEKTQARTNAVMEKGKDIAGSYEAAMGFAGKQITSMKRYMDDLKVKAGEVFQDALTVAVGWATDGLKELNGEIDDLARKDQLDKWGRRGLMTMAFVADAVRYPIIMFKSLADTLAWSASTLVSWGVIAKRAMTLDFSGAADEYRLMSAVTKAYNADMAKAFGGPSFQERAQGFLATKDSAGPARDMAKKQKTEQETNQAAAVKSFQEKSKIILDIEKDRIHRLLEIEKEFGKKLQDQYNERVSALDSFRSAYDAILQSKSDRDKARLEAEAAATRGAEDGYQKYYRTQAELAQSQNDLDNESTWSSESIAKRLKAYDDLIRKSADQLAAVKSGSVENISLEQAEYNHRAQREALEQRIIGLGDRQLKTMENSAVTAAQESDAWQRRIQATEDRVRMLDQMLQNLPKVKQIDINLRINGIDDLQQISGVIGGAQATAAAQHFGDYYTMGGKTFWNDGTLAENGTSTALPQYANGTDYVPRTGPAIVHQGEKIIPAGQNSGVTIGSISITLTSTGNAQTDADQLARALMPAINKQMGRSLAA